MAQDSKIQWTTDTINLWFGCTKVHSGCDNCYAESLSKRFGNDVWGNDKERLEVKSAWNNLVKYQKLAEKSNEIRRVFVGSMMDIFEKPMPLINSAIPEYTTGVLRDRLFDQISNGWYPNLMFLFLTKRPSNINKYIPESWKINPPKNIMFGTSPVNQSTSNKLIKQLLQVNGKKFLSMEPQLDRIELDENWLIGSPFQSGQIDWIIQGGESGHHKRPFNTDWAREIRDFCAKFKTPYFFKQIDKIKEIPEDLMVRQFPEHYQHK